MAVDKVSSAEGLGGSAIQALTQLAINRSKQAIDQQRTQAEVALKVRDQQFQQQLSVAQMQAQLAEEQRQREFQRGIEQERMELRRWETEQGLQLDRERMEHETGIAEKNLKLRAEEQKQQEQAFAAEEEQREIENSRFEKLESQRKTLEEDLRELVDKQGEEREAAQAEIDEKTRAFDEAAVNAEVGRVLTQLDEGTMSTGDIMGMVTEVGEQEAFLTQHRSNLFLTASNNFVTLMSEQDEEGEKFANPIERLVDVVADSASAGKGGELNKDGEATSESLRPGLRNYFISLKEGRKDQAEAALRQLETQYGKEIHGIIAQIGGLMSDGALESRESMIQRILMQQGIENTPANRREVGRNAWRLEKRMKKIRDELGASGWRMLKQTLEWENGAPHATLRDEKAAQAFGEQVAKTVSGVSPITILEQLHNRGALKDGLQEEEFLEAAQIFVQEAKQGAIDSGLKDGGSAEHWEKFGKKWAEREWNRLRSSRKDIVAFLDDTPHFFQKSPYERARMLEDAQRDLEEAQGRLDAMDRRHDRELQVEQVY